MILPMPENIDYENIREYLYDAGKALRALLSENIVMQLEVYIFQIYIGGLLEKVYDKIYVQIYKTGRINL